MHPRGLNCRVLVDGFVCRYLLKKYLLKLPIIIFCILGVRGLVVVITVVVTDAR